MIDHLMNSSIDAQLGSTPLASGLSNLSLTQIGATDWLFGAFLTILAALIVSEKRRALIKPGAAELKCSYLTNFKTFLFNDFTLSILQVPALAVIAENYSGSGLLSQFEPGLAVTVVAFLLLDLTMYAWHYLSHHWDWLWVLHRIHHSDRSVNVTTGLRYHIGEMFLEALLRAAFVVVVGVGLETLLICQGLMSLFILLHHSNLRLSGERWLSLFVVVPGLHRRHHSVLRSEHDSNYGAVFTCWDRVFRTLEYGEPRAIGLHGVAHDSFLGIIRDLLPIRAGAKDLLAPPRLMARALARRSGGDQGGR